MSDADFGASSPARGAPLVATWGRWAACTATVAVVLAAALQGSLAFMHSAGTIRSHAEGLGAAVALAALLLFWLLRAEEARLARELRIARTGTASLRSLVVDRRQQLPFFARPFSTKLGTTAVLLATGDRVFAGELLAAAAPLMSGGRLRQLRQIVEADAERAAGTSEGLDGCIARLCSYAQLGNREADLYALHVLAKAVLERGDEEAALSLVQRLEQSHDDERLYLIWLRTWFDLDGPAISGAPAPEPGGEGPGTASGPPLSQGEVRLAALLARAHGAEKLVEKLEKQASAIARAHREE